MSDQHAHKLTIKLLAATAAVLGSLVGLISIVAQAQRPDSGNWDGAPLTLKAVGSFYVGGRRVSRNAGQVGVYGAGSLAVDQMYVQYVIPDKATGPAVVMVHGGTLSGASFESTPDGRMGWHEYFARRGFPSYVVDQVGRGRSGFDHSVYNDVRSGVARPSSQPNMRRVADDVAWVRFRFGPRAGVAFKDSQFPTQAANQFSKQTVPDMSTNPPAPDDPNFVALSQLAHKLEQAVLVGHSQSGQFPFRTALRDPVGIKALIAIEPGGCDAASYSEEKLTALSRLPILIIFGDHLDAPQKFGPSWLPLFRDCQEFVSRINLAGGQARMLHTVDLNIRGNSHMMMQDRNNLQIADLLVKWIKEQ